VTLEAAILKQLCEKTFIALAIGKMFSGIITPPVQKQRAVFVCCGETKNCFPD
jgi:hypothetical protein